MKTILFLGVFITFTRCTEHKYEKVEDHNKHYHIDWNQAKPTSLDHYHGYNGEWNHNHNDDYNRNDSNE